MNFDGDRIVALVGLLMVLVINWRALQSHQLQRWQKIRLALIWGSVIAGVTLLVKLFQP